MYEIETKTLIQKARILEAELLAQVDDGTMTDKELFYEVTENTALYPIVLIGMIRQGAAAKGEKEELDELVGAGIERLAHTLAGKDAALQICILGSMITCVVRTVLAAAGNLDDHMFEGAPEAVSGNHTGGSQSAPDEPAAD